jgi:hypothetical protein
MDESKILGMARPICEQHGILLRAVSRLPVGGGFAVSIAVPPSLDLDAPEVNRARELLEAIPEVNSVWVELAVVQE